MPVLAEDNVSVTKTPDLSLPHHPVLTPISLSKSVPVQSQKKSEKLNNTLPADVTKIQQQNLTNLASEPLKIAQITSESPSFSDVQPSDWAFQALKSLVERYGCTASDPIITFRGNRALTRYEFAAILNACIDRINELILTASSDLVKKEDLVTLQKLQEQFATELAVLRGRF